MRGLRGLAQRTDKLNAQGYRGVGQELPPPVHTEVGKELRKIGYQVKYLKLDYKVKVYVKADYPHIDDQPEQIYQSVVRGPHNR